MLFIYFQHSIKYLYAQLGPYVALTVFTAYKSCSLDLVWLMAYLTMSAILLWRLISLTSTTYIFTHDMLIISKGLLFRDADCRSLHQLKGMQPETNRLLRLLGVSHLSCGLEGPPADRVRIVGIDDRTMVRILEELAAGIDLNTTMWREHFKTTAA